MHSRFEGRLIKAATRQGGMKNWQGMLSLVMGSMALFKDSAFLA